MSSSISHSNVRMQKYTPSVFSYATSNASDRQLSKSSCFKNLNIFTWNMKEDSVGSYATYKAYPQKTLLSSL